MSSFVSRVAVCLLVLLPTIQPALACDCGPEVCCACDCESMWTACESYVPCCTESFVPFGDCEFSEPFVDSTQESAENEPFQATAEPLTPPSEEPKTMLPAPAAEKPTPIKPAAPIAVPQPEKEVAPPTDDLFPGPVPPADKAPFQLEPEKKSDIDELFEEPSAISEPQPLPSNETKTPPANSTEALFVEPQQDTEQAPAEKSSEVKETKTEEETTKSEPSAEPEEESKAFEDLFGPTDEEPEPEPKAAPDPFDPFGQEELPFGMRGASGIANTAPRHWSDSSASFSCHAHFVSITAKSVVLEKDSGVRVAVPIKLLSDADLAYVRGRIQDLRMVLAREALAAQLAASWAQ